MSVHSKLLRALVFVIAVISFSDLRAMGQDRSITQPPELSEHSSLDGIIRWLKERGFPYAQIGLRKKGGHRQSSIPRRSDSPFPDQELIFSDGFQLTAVNGCHLSLSMNDPAIVYSHPSWGTFYEFISEKKGRPKLVPGVGVVSLSLDRMSDKKGKPPHLDKIDRQKAPLLKPWRSDFDKKGWFNRDIVQMELTSTDQPPTKEYGDFDYLSFSFDNKDLAEQFTIAFSRAIKACISK